MGQNHREEVDIVSSGGNFGWNVKVGTRCFAAAAPEDDAREFYVLTTEMAGSEGTTGKVYRLVPR